MTRLFKHPISIILIGLMLVFLSSCTGHKAKVAFYTFFFYLIFVVSCMPGIIFSATARGNGSKAAMVTGIIFTSIGGFFAIIYTFNCLDDFHRRIDDEILLYLFLIWGTLIGSLILLVIPNQKLKAKQRMSGKQKIIIPRQQHSPSSDPLQFATDATIINKEDEEGNTDAKDPHEVSSDQADESKTREMTDDDIDMSGLDSL